eukprot:Pgem_evm2s13733
MKFHYLLPLAVSLSTVDNCYGHRFAIDGGAIDLCVAVDNSLYAIDGDFIRKDCISMHDNGDTIFEKWVDVFPETEKKDRNNNNTKGVYAAATKDNDGYIYLPPMGNVATFKLTKPKKPEDNFNILGGTQMPNGDFLFCTGSSGKRSLLQLGGYNHNRRRSAAPSRNQIGQFHAPNNKVAEWRFANEAMVEDSEGNIVFSDYEIIYKIKADGQLMKSIEPRPFNVTYPGSNRPSLVEA